MHIQSYEVPSDFLDRAEPLLMENEVLNNLPLGIAYRLVQSIKHTAKDAHHEGPLPFMAILSDGQQDILVLLKTTAHLIVYISDKVQSHDARSNAISVAIDYILHQEVIPVPSIIAFHETAHLFAEKWKEVTGQSYGVQMDQRIYACTKVQDVKLSPGIFRASELRDIPMLAEWIYDFAKEASEEITHKQAFEMAQRGTDQCAIYLWDDGEPVSMAQQTRPTLHGAVVNMVYTPFEHRNKGYASSCVSTLTRNMLRGPYEFASLYTDMSNPISNHIYMKVGYEPRSDSVVLVFNS
jgi:predicted GNAT family acetyltransferase